MSTSDPAQLYARAATESIDPRFLVYGLPSCGELERWQVCKCGEIVFQSAPLNDQESFLNYDGVVIMAGSFEVPRPGAPQLRIPCNVHDLERRVKEFYSLVAAGNVFLFLVPFMPNEYGQSPNTDLFRRFMADEGILWSPSYPPKSQIISSIPEFQDFFTEFGSGFTILDLRRYDRRGYTPICGKPEQTFAVVFDEKIFILPCLVPGTHQQAVEIAASGLQSMLAYRKRISQEIPEWLRAFSFHNEKTLREKEEKTQQELSDLQKKSKITTHSKGRYVGDPIPWLRSWSRFSQANSG